MKLPGSAEDRKSVGGGSDGFNRTRVHRCERCKRLGHAEFSEKVAMLGACGSRESLHPFANKKKVPGVGGGIPGMLSVPVWVLAMH